MKRPTRATAPQFSHPVRQILLILVVMALVAAGAWVALPRVSSLFLANPWLNGFILLVFAIGVLACLWQVVQLSRSVNWIEGFAADRPGHDPGAAPRLLAPLATLLGPRGARTRITATSARSILDSVAARIEEERDITRYIINLLIFLGLLGTFYGLAITVPAVVETIRSLAPTEGESSIAVFDRLMTGLEAQLGGMGTAFSTSLLGLAGSLVVGLLELFVGHGQSRFYRQLEEWLSSITRLGIAAGEGEGGADQSTLVEMFEQLAERLEAMQEMQERMATDRAQLDDRMMRLTEAVERLAAGGGAEMSAAMMRVADGQDRLAQLIETQGGLEGDGMDSEARMRLRSIDVHLLRILEEMAAGREETLTDLRSDIAHLTQAVRQSGRAPVGAGLPGRGG